MAKRAKATTGDEPPQTITFPGFSTWQVLLGPPGFKRRAVGSRLPGVYCIGVRPLIRSTFRAVYVGETGRSLAERLREHRSTSSHLYGVIQQELDYGNVVYCRWRELETKGDARRLEAAYLRAFGGQWYWNAIGYGHATPRKPFPKANRRTFQRYLEETDPNYEDPDRGRR